jgi:hypothetical protein
VAGEPVSLHARATDDRPVSASGDPLPKQLWPGSSAGPSYDARGLFFADRLGQRLLRGDVAGVKTVLICEGLTDWLSAAAWHLHRDCKDVAVLGGVSGSFPALAQVSWPKHPIDIIIAVDADDAGARFLRQIRDALPGRALRRLQLTVGP